MNECNELQWAERLSPAWEDLRRDFLRAVSPVQRAHVAAYLRDGDSRGRGLRTWLRLIAAQGRVPSAAYPTALVQTYLDDDEAMPLYDCADCGVAIPVRPDWQGADSEPQEIYFPRCPCCGGRTGLYAAWSQASASAEVTVAR